MIDVQDFLQNRHTKKPKITHYVEVSEDIILKKELQTSTLYWAFGCH